MTQERSSTRATASAIERCDGLVPRRARPTHARLFGERGAPWAVCSGSCRPPALPDIADSPPRSAEQCVRAAALDAAQVLDATASAASGLDALVGLAPTEFRSDLATTLCASNAYTFATTHSRDLARRATASDGPEATSCPLYRRSPGSWRRRRTERHRAPALDARRDRGTRSRARTHAGLATRVEGRVRRHDLVLWATQRATGPSSTSTRQGRPPRSTSRNTSSVLTSGVDQRATPPCRSGSPPSPCRRVVGRRPLVEEGQLPPRSRWRRVALSISGSRRAEARQRRHAVVRQRAEPAALR